MGLSRAVNIESDLLESASVDLGWELIERFATLVRESGSADEATAAAYIVEQLKRLNVEHVVFEPVLYLSLPRESSVEIAGSPPLAFRAKPPSFAAPTPSEGLSAGAVYVPAADMRDVGDIFEDRLGSLGDVQGKIVVSDGYAMPLPVEQFSRAGAVGQIYINPGRNIHWGICTPIWGTPTDSTLDRKPSVPVVAINRPDGERLRERIAAGPIAVTIRSALDEGWYPCQLPVATIRGETPDFVLVHGHYDSWDVGIGDNAVGDAMLLELARVFHTHRDQLNRSLKIAWWPAHSTGRYGGSTWFADEFALELRKHCVAAVNIDSPGCRRADAYEDVMWMAEADSLCRGTIADATGSTPERRRPVRAGDYSFNQLGLTSFFMLLSNIPKETRDKLGFYAVGGCGGNIAWHTEDDGLEVADRDNFKRDLRVYMTAIARVLNSEILPFDFRSTLAEISEAIDTYREEGGALADLSPIDQELSVLRSALGKLYKDIEAPDRSAPNDEVNAVIKALARILVPLNYSTGGPFSHDPALPLRTVPKLAAISKLKSYADERSARLPFLQAEIRRQVNDVANALYEAAQVVQRVE